jgi:hypothetical protein
LDGSLLLSLSEIPSRDKGEFIDVYVSRATRLRDCDTKEVEEGRYVFLQELAGSITALLTMFWFTVARRPGVFQKLRNEVLQALWDRLPTFEELKSLKYLNWTLREAKMTLTLGPGDLLIAKQFNAYIQSSPSTQESLW